ncbi:MAG: class I SAM-dependent methyltransferase [Patescibacteria group bacterium]
MPQESSWDREYRKSKLLTKENKPQADVVRFLTFITQKSHTKYILPKNTSVLDLGSGTGRNSFYFTQLGAHVIGFEFSQTAIDIAQKYARDAGLTINYQKRSIGAKFPLDSESVDIALDVTSSNSLTQTERELFLSETHRVLKHDGYFFTKALCKDGDENAKYLLKHSPGPENDTYILPDIGVFERVWSKSDFINTYEKYFKIVNLEKKTSYSRMNDRVYKRNFWIVYMQKSSM